MPGRMRWMKMESTWMQIDEERSLRSVKSANEGDCRRKTTVTVQIRHERVCDKHVSKCPNPRLLLKILGVSQPLKVLQRKGSWMKSVNSSTIQPCFLTPLQPDEQVTKKAKTETEHVAHGSVCSILRSLCISHMFYRREKAKSVKAKFL